MSWFRWRRPVRPLGTLGGNRSEVDDVLERGPLGMSQGLYADEREAAARADIGVDVESDFDDYGDAEDRMWDSLGRHDGADGGDNSKDAANGAPGQQSPPPEAPGNEKPV